MRLLVVPYLDSCEVVLLVVHNNFESITCIVAPYKDYKEDRKIFRITIGMGNALFIVIWQVQVLNFCRQQ
jgi:hypothetical protein